MKEESFLEDINSLLNSGEVPNIFTADEKEDLCEKMGQLDKQRDKSLQVRIFIFFLIYFTVKKVCTLQKRGVRIVISAET
jgi:dynein heavy chain